MRILETLSWAEIAVGPRGDRPWGRPVGVPSGASIDTRTLEPGDIFFALKGEHVDGHEHVASAFEKGRVLRGHQGRGPGPSPVDSPWWWRIRRRRLFELGASRAVAESAAFVAVTGSAGKTTAKEFTAELLRARGEVLATRGNLNNHLGVPLTLARLETEHWAAVIECGMSRPGELPTSRSPDPAEGRGRHQRGRGASRVLRLGRRRSPRPRPRSSRPSDAGDTAVAPADEPLLPSRARDSPVRARLFGDGRRLFDPRRRRRRCPSKARAFSSTASTDRGSRSTLPAPGPHAISNFLAAAAVAAGARASAAKPSPSGPGC